jgi:hypothetical protein
MGFRCLAPVTATASHALELLLMMMIIIIVIITVIILVLPGIEPGPLYL